MANTFTLIEAQTVGTAVATITFSSIPQTYTDLKILVSARTTYAGLYDDLRLGINGQTAGSWQAVYTVNGSSASKISTSTNVGYGAQSNGANATATTFSNVEVYIPNYTSTDVKSISIDSVSENNAAAATLFLNALSLTNATAINNITFTSDNGANIVQYSTFYLYGIRNS